MHVKVKLVINKIAKEFLFLIVPWSSHPKYITCSARLLLLVFPLDCHFVLNHRSDIMRPFNDQYNSESFATISTSVTVAKF